MVWVVTFGVVPVVCITVASVLGTVVSFFGAVADVFRPVVGFAGTVVLTVSVTGEEITPVCGADWMEFGVVFEAK